MKTAAMLFIFCSALLLTPLPVQAGGTKVCKAIPHGRVCYVDGKRVSIVCKPGYQVSPPWGTRCVKVQ